MIGCGSYNNGENQAHILYSTVGIGKVGDAWELGLPAPLLGIHVGLSLELLHHLLLLVALEA